MYHIRLNAPIGKTVGEYIREAGLAFPFPCGGHGSCGKCLIMPRGSFQDATPAELLLLGQRAEQGYRLACFCVPLSDFSFEFFNSYEITQQGLASDIRENSRLVVDLGTTTVHAAVYNEETPVCSLTQLNITSAFGADVISRLENNSKQQSQLLREQISSLSNSLGFSEPSVICGNTAMLHIYEGLPTETMCTAPFTPSSKFGLEKDSTYFPPCVSAFVGADLICGALYCEIDKKPGSLLIDIGTNAELIYNDGERLLCTSAAAGPALEGVGISHGSYAVEGAIDKFYVLNSRLEYHCIGGGRAKSICGSGIISLLSALLQLGIISAESKLCEPFFIPESSVSLSPEDVEAVVLAKAAIAAALKIMLKDAASVEQVYISGAFGNSLDLDACISIGLLPREFRHKTTVVKNTAIEGANLLSLKPSLRQRAVEIANRASLIELALQPEFEKIFLNELFI